MKKTFKFTGIIIFFISFMIITACSRDEDMILGTWMCTASTGDGDIERADNIYRGAIITFKDDCTYVSSKSGLMGQGKLEDSWALIDNQLIIGGYSDNSFVITKLTRSKLRIEGHYNRYFPGLLTREFEKR